MKNRYIEIAKERFSSETLDILLKQIELFYKEDVIVKKNRYDVGEDVYLKKGTFIHGIFGLKDGFDFILQNGFISTDFTDNPRPNKICNNTGMWDIKNDCLLFRSLASSKLCFTSGWYSIAIEEAMLLWIDKEKKD